MNEHEALSKMVAPGTPRPGKFLGGVIQIWLTRACDNSCFGCTQAGNIRGKAGMITIEQFEKACRSLAGYWGVVGIFGGNPALHPEFGTICSILRDHFPKTQRGIWCNHPRGNGSVMRETFNPAVSNLNVHMDHEAYNEFKRDWPECNPFGLREDCRHSPPFVAMKDLIPDETAQWDLIANCDINHHWSAILCVVQGNLRAYFCEIAGAQAMINPELPDVGLDPYPGWWKEPMSIFVDQVKAHCPMCGVPLRGYGNLAKDPEGIEYTSKSWAKVYLPKVPRAVLVAETLEDIKPQSLRRFTNYVGNANL